MGIVLMEKNMNTDILAIKIERNLINQQIIASILDISLKPIPLAQMLHETLALVLSSHGLALKSMGSIFLVKESTRELTMVAQQGLHEHLLTACATVPFGYCLCGRAAESGKVVFTDRIDHRHDVTFPGIKPHGHYCVPIKGEGQLLGVLNMYVPAWHERTAD